jgi:hypothetical protein
MAFTVVPLHNVELAAGTRIPFGNDLVFQDTPSWVKEDRSFLKYLGHHVEYSILNAHHAFVAEYEANSIGEPDPEQIVKDGEQQQTIQQAKTRLAIVGNFAIWLRQPSPVCFTVSLHACLWGQFPNHTDKLPILQQSETLEPLHFRPWEKSKPLYCHPKDVNNPITASHIVRAAEFYPTIRSIQKGNAAFVALRATWAALTSYAVDERYLWFWIALEALFGPEDSNELSHKLAERIAFFIAESPEGAREIFHKAKKCYGVRSKIVHGRWKSSPEIDQLMEDTEAIVRTSFRHIIEKPGLLSIFTSKQRDEYLTNLVFAKRMPTSLDDK